MDVDSDPLLYIFIKTENLKCPSYLFMQGLKLAPCTCQIKVKIGIWRII